MEKIHRSVVRNNAYSRSGISIRERHNERKNECYSNEDITSERSHLNVYYKKCESTYIEYFDKLVDERVISTRGLQVDASIIDEFVFDVNTEYFETYGGYDYAKEFFADAYQMAIKEAGDERYIISAVMHADERNRELSEKLGRDVFHYHLHVVYVPVVEKEVKWTKRCKDKSLVGKTKEIIHQVSHSKKWGFQKATDKNGKELKTSSGKTKLIVPYSELQDSFFEYMKNPDNPKQLAVDEEAAKVVRYIYELCICGMGPTKIARQLIEDKIPTPTAYFKEHGMPYNTKKAINTKRDGQSVIYILENMVYLGHTVNFKTTTKSYKSHKTIDLPQEEWRIFENTHPAIIEKSVWDKVQELRKNKRRNTKSGKTSIFSGVLECADCGAKLYFCTSKKFEDRQDHFVCSNHKGNTGSCSAHFIREEVLQKVVLGQIQLMLDYLYAFEDDFVKTLMDKSLKDKKKELSTKKKKIDTNNKRITELDDIFKRLYEDNLSGKITDKRFKKLSKDYEEEQKFLKAETETLETELAQSEETINNVEYFLKIVRQYTNIRELNARVVNDLIDKIKIHAPIKENGQRIQQIDIYYTAVGVIDIPQHFQEFAI